MPNRFIYVYEGGNQDPSRWLQVAPGPNGECVLDLQDLCFPGKLSQFTTVTCPTRFLWTAVERGPLQITTGTGYLLLRRMGDLLRLEFRGLDDISVTKASVRIEDLRARLEELGAEVLVSLG